MTRSPYMHIYGAGMLLQWLDGTRYHSNRVTLRFLRTNIFSVYLIAPYVHVWNSDAEED